MALVAVGTAVGIVVCFPFFGGRVLLLDWVSGPHAPLVPQSVWGLGTPSAAGALPWLVLGAVMHVAGSAGSWVPLLAFFPVAVVAAGRLTGGRGAAQVGAGVLYAVNPLVFDRLYAGQVLFLVGYALLPFAVRSLVASSMGSSPWTAGLWTGAVVSCSVQFAWVLGVVVVVALGALAVRHGTLRRLGGLCLAAAVGAVTSAYLAVGLVTSGVRLSDPLAQLAAYQTSGDPRYGLFVNVAGLYGFWRPGPEEAKNVVSGWVFVLVGLLVVAALGYAAALRDPGRRLLGGCMLVCGGIGYVLALGSQGPTGSLFRLAFLHVPGFAVMREPQKFLVLVALCYATGFGWGVDRLVEGGATHRRRVAVGALVLALPWAYTPNLVDGLGGQVKAANYPASWRTVAQLVQGTSRVLFLPWHEYQAFPFTDGRVVDTPAADVLPAPVLVSQDAGAGYRSGPVPPEDAFVNAVVGRGPTVDDAGALLAIIGVRWIVVAKVNDWRSYTWLGHQYDLQLVYDTGGIELFRNRVAPAVPQWVPELTSVPNVGALVAAADPDPSARVTSVRTSTPSAGVRRAGDGPSGVALGLRQLSPVDYHVTPGSPAPPGPGWALLPLAYQRGWSLGGRPAVRLATGELAVPTGEGGDLSFDGFPPLIAGYCASGAAVMMAMGAELHRRRRARQAGKDASVVEAGGRPA